MKEQIEEKLATGFRCVKLKIGAIDFDKELQLLRYIRANFSPEQVEIRVDANGAFDKNNALDKLIQLSEFKLSTALLLQGKPIAEAKPEAMLEIELNAAENADVALFWLDESLLYLQGENSSFLKELDPKAMFAKGYSWSQYSQLQSLGAEATLAEHARFIHPFTNNYAESIALGFSGDQTRMRMRVPAPPPFVPPLPP